LKKNKLSIAIPIFNGAKTISSTLESIVGNYDINIVISDNCSTDGTLEILKSFEKKYDNIKLNINPTNIGFDGNLNKCIQLCDTKYVWLLTDDDIVVNNGLDEINNVVNDDNDYGIIYVDNLLEFSKITSSVSGDNPNDFFNLTRFRSGGMSSNIINRNDWLNINFKNYPKDWPHLIYAIIILTNKKYYIHYKSLKYESDPNMTKRWLKNVGLFNYLYSLKDTFSIMSNYSIYNKSTIKKTNCIVAKNITTAIIINKKFKINFDLKSLIFVLKESRKYIFKNLLFLLIPQSLYENIKKIFK
jgi:glycosyltransferase involved in cell wall biosynthesis